MSSGFGTPVRVQSRTPKDDETMVNSTYRPSTWNPGPRLLAGIVVRPSVLMMLPSFMPLMTKPPPSQPTDDAAWTGSAVGGANASPAATMSTLLARQSANET